MTVAAFFPLLFAACGVEASHDPIIEAVDKTAAINQVRELGLQPDGFPNPGSAQFARGILLDMQELSADSTSPRNQQTVVRKHDGRVNMRMAARLAILPKELPALAVVCANP